MEIISLNKINNKTEKLIEPIGRVEMTEDKLTVRSIEYFQSEKQKVNWNKKKEQNFREL